MIEYFSQMVNCYDNETKREELASCILKTILNLLRFEQGLFVEILEIDVEEILLFGF